jgi:propanol-preferring alcohol dehydrogenase
MSSSKTMRAAVLQQLKHPLEVKRVPLPELEHGEVLVRTKACGICGTDLHIFEGTGYKPNLPHILGHEPSGVVERLGEGTHRLKVGDRVIPNIFFTCGECFYCRTNRETLCVNFKGALGVGINGGYAEFFKAPEKNLFPLPSNIPFPEGGVIADAVVTAVHAVRRRAQVRAGDTILVLGLGGVGQSVIQVAKKSGATVAAAARRQVRLDHAKKIGADYLINSSTQDVGEEIKAVTGGTGADVVIDDIGSSQSVSQAVAAVKKGGRIVMIGETDDTLPVPTFQLCVNEYEILGSRSGGRQDTLEAIQLVASGDVTPYVSDRFPLERVNDAFQHIQQGDVLGRAVITFE